MYEEFVGQGRKLEPHVVGVDGQTVEVHIEHGGRGRARSKVDGKGCELTRDVLTVELDLHSSLAVMADLQALTHCSSPLSALPRLTTLHLQSLPNWAPSQWM